LEKKLKSCEPNLIFVVVGLGGKNMEIKVGDGATKYVGSDRYPYTVVEVLSPKKVVVQGDDFKRTDNNGMSESQTYEYTRNPFSDKITLTLRKNGRWVQQGEPLNGTGYRLGDRDCHMDPHF
jgi:hypothetical protein